VSDGLMLRTELVGADVEPVPPPTVAGRRRRRRAGTGSLVAGLAVVGVIALCGVFAGLVGRVDPLEQDLAIRLQGPSWDHWFGTDELGRDVWSRCIHAIRIDLLLGALGALFPALLGTVIGATAGYAGRWVDASLMRLADIVQAFPFHIFLIAIVFALGAGPRPFVIAITVLGWVPYARLVRAEVLRAREADYVTALRLAGLGHTRILGRHVLPNVLPQSALYFASDVTVVLLTLASVSFFGLGVQPPNPEWGQMIATGAKYLQNEWWLAVFPGVMIVITGIGLLMISDGLHDRREDS
jgi:peptide/nickel transport system permease protein